MEKALRKRFTALDSGSQPVAARAVIESFERLSDLGLVSRWVGELTSRYSSERNVRRGTALSIPSRKVAWVYGWEDGVGAGKGRIGQEWGISHGFGGLCGWGDILILGMNSTKGGE